MMRVIFDRSAFHGERFEVLRASPVANLVKAGKVQVHHTVTFLEETLKARGSRAPWQEHLRFALDLDDRFLFRDLSDIWREELVQGRGPFARLYHPERRTRSRPHTRTWLRQRLLDMFDDAEADSLWAETKTELADIKEKKRRYRSLSVEIRDKVAREVRSMPGGPPGDKARAFRDFLKSDRRTGTARILMPLVSPLHADRLATLWAQDPTRYPFYSAFVDSFMYMGFYAGVEQGRPLDANDQVDYQQLCHLCAADIFVSNDEGFPWDCFSMLWAPLGKRYLSCEEFCELVERLA